MQLTPNPSSTNKIILGFDFGLKHIGVAIGQSITHTASPLTTLQARDGIPHWPEIQTLIAQWRPTDLVVGMPLQMDGSEQLLTFCARKFINRLRERCTVPIHEVDERLSSWEAKTRRDQAVGKKAKTQSKGTSVHAYAALILIEQWMRDPGNL